MLALVISETLRHGRRNGLKVAAAPLITDIPIVALSILVLAQLSESDVILGAISIVGGLFVGYLSYGSLVVKGLEMEESSGPSHSLLKGVTLNFVNPNPYLFWIGVGAPTVLTAYGRSAPAAVAYLVSFYALLVGSKVGVALLADRSREALRSRLYVWVMRALGLCLLVFAVLFVREGLGRLTERSSVSLLRVRSATKPEGWVTTGRLRLPVVCEFGFAKLVEWVTVWKDRVGH